MLSRRGLGVRSIVSASPVSELTEIAWMVEVISELNSKPPAISNVVGPKLAGAALCDRCLDQEEDEDLF